MKFRARNGYVLLETAPGELGHLSAASLMKGVAITLGDKEGGILLNELREAVTRAAHENAILEGHDDEIRIRECLAAPTWGACQLCKGGSDG